MEKELAKYFRKAKYEGEVNLPSNIWNGIVKREKRNTRIRLWIFSLMGSACLIGIIPAGKALYSDLVQSGIYEYISLIFSGGSSVFSYWKELSFSIAESIPVGSMILSLSLVFMLFLSLKHISRQIIKGQLSHPGFLTLSF